MEKDKSRGFKHVKDKKKFRSKPSTKTVQPVTHKPKQLDSNWDRYEQEEATEHVLDSRTDFGILANAPVTQGSHFQFKNDTEELAESPEELFKLDVNLLSLSIGTVPFYELIGVDFNESLKKRMDKIAEFNSKEYKIYLEKCSEKSTIAEETISTKIDDISTSVDKVEAVIVEAKIVDTSVKKNDNDLETWLDDILDD